MAKSKNKLKGTQKYNYVKRESIIFKFERSGDRVEGILYDIQPSNGEYGENKIYSVDTENGEVKFFGSTILNSQIRESDIGKQILVERISEKSGRATGFDIFVVE